MTKKKTFIVYKIYYGNELVYVGRTHQQLQDRIRGHLFKAPNMKVIDINLVSKIEYTVLASEADMFLVELYLICLHKPKLNKDDKPHDELTMHLPAFTFHEWQTPLWDKWVDEINLADYKHKILEKKKTVAEEQFRIKKREILDLYTKGEISHDEYYDLCEEIRQDRARFQYEIGELSFREYREAMGFFDAG